MKKEYAVFSRATYVKARLISQFSSSFLDNAVYEPGSSWILRPFVNYMCVGLNAGQSCLPEDKLIAKLIAT